MPDAIVIGGGLHGLSAALHLALRGLSVRLFEKDSTGRHASGVNAGGVRRLGRALPEIPLSVASMEMWHRIAELVEDDCGFESHGQVKVAESEAELEALRARRDQVRAAGFDHEELVDQAELRALVPAIAPHCVGALVSRADGAALPFRTVQAFRARAVRLGAVVSEGLGIARIRRTHGVWRVEATDGSREEAPLLVNAAGAWAGNLAAQVGEPVPVEVVAPMLMITGRRPPFLRPVVGAAGRTLSFKQFPNGTVLIGGGHLGRALPEENRTELDFAELAVNAQTVAALFPAMRDAQILRAWAGIEARMPDGIPVLGPGRTEEGLFHAFGFSAHGFQLGPVSGAIAAEVLTTGRTNLPIAPFSIGRFRPPAPGGPPPG